MVWSVGGHRDGRLGLAVEGARSTEGGAESTEGGAGQPQLAAGWAVAGGVGGGVILLVPWVLVTGSSAYNELVVVGFAATAWAALVQMRSGTVPRQDPKHASLAPTRGVPGALETSAIIGVLVGAATLAKLTAGFTVALPWGALLLGTLVSQSGRRDGGQPEDVKSVAGDVYEDADRDGTAGPLTARFKRSGVLGPVGVCVAMGVVVLLPYLVRNAAWTGNPVFPFAGSVLGTGHWDAERLERWDAAHMPDETWNQWGSAIWRQALGNTGYVLSAAIRRRGKARTLRGLSTKAGSRFSGSRGPRD